MTAELTGAIVSNEVDVVVSYTTSQDVTIRVHNPWPQSASQKPPASPF